MDFASRLSELVAECGLPKYKIGEAAKVSDSHISAMCAGKKELGKIETAIALADFFGVSLDYLLCRSDERGESIRKCPAFDVSDSGRKMLEYFEALERDEQMFLIGEARGLLLAKKKDGESITVASAG